MAGKENLKRGEAEAQMPWKGKGRASGAQAGPP